MSEEWRGDPEEEAVQKVLSGAGPRAALPEEDLRAIRDAAHLEWSRRYGARPERRRSPRRWLPLAAAFLAGAVGLAWWIRSRPAEVAPTVASVERVTGSAPWTVGSPVVAGSRLDTGAAAPGRLTLRMRGGASVRLDAATQLTVASATMVELERGAVYVDTGAPTARAEDVAVRAASTLFRPAGTQFQVRVGGRDAKLQVREGRVVVDRGTESVVAAAGEEVVVSEDGRVVRRPGTVSGGDWAWVGESAPAFAIEGVKLREFLNWIRRETGLRVELADSEAAAVADSCVLHGSIENLTLNDAPGVVLSSCGLGSRVSDGTLVVFATGKNGRPAR